MQTQCVCTTCISDYIIQQYRNQMEYFHLFWHLIVSYLLYVHKLRDERSIVSLSRKTSMQSKPAIYDFIIICFHQIINILLYSFISFMKDCRLYPSSNSPRTNSTSQFRYKYEFSFKPCIHFQTSILSIHILYVSLFKS